MGKQSRIKKWLREKAHKCAYREGGADLGHGDADEPGEEGDDDPAPDEGGRPRVLQAGPVQRRDPREERHRREGDGQRLEQRLQGTQHKYSIKYSILPHLENRKSKTSSSRSSLERKPTKITFLLPMMLCL